MVRMINGSGLLRVLACGAFALIAIEGFGPAPAGAQIMEELAKPHEGRSMRATSTARIKGDEKGEYDPNSNSDNRRVEPGKTHVLLDAQGPGAITHIWMTFMGPDPEGWTPNGSANHQEMLLRIFYDGNERPGVEAPVGDFFANCFGQRREVISLPVAVEDADSYNCFWRMPFRKSVRVEIVNQSEKNINCLYYNIDWVKLDKLADDAPYFYAQYHQEYPVEKGKDYVILDTKGKGHYVGTVLAVRTRSPSWFGEGDEKIYIDGEEKASIWGTGTEDYILSAWGLKTTSTPYFGTSYFDQWGIVGGHTAAYRWHMNDAIVFNTGIKVTLEHFGWIGPDENPEHKFDSWNEREDDYASVAFWYQTGQPTFTARAPDGPQRKLPNLDQIIYAAAQKGEVRNGPGEVSVAGGEKGQLVYRPKSADDAWIEIPFEVKEKTPVRLLLNMARSSDLGRYQVSLDGVKLRGPADYYRAEADLWEFHLIDFWPDAGKHTIRLDCVGKAGQSDGYGLAIESIRLRERRPRVKQWAHEKNDDWKASPKLYE